MNRPLATFLVSLLLIFGCNPSHEPSSSPAPATDTHASPAPPIEDLPVQEGYFQASYAEEMEAAIQELYAKPEHKVLDEIPAIKLFSYLSGYYVSGHPFPIIFLDPKAQQFTVTHKAFQAHYPADKQDEALESFFNQLVEHGYEIDGQRKESYSSIKVDGEERVLVKLSDLFPDGSETKKHFSAAQYSFLHNELNPSQGFAYLSGFANNGRDYPLMAGTGYQSSARLNLLARGMAMEFEFKDLDLAFDKFEEYLKKGRQ